MSESVTAYCRKCKRAMEIVEPKHEFTSSGEVVRGKCVCGADLCRILNQRGWR